MTVPCHPRKGDRLIYGQAIGADTSMQIEVHSLKINNLKLLCLYLSRQHAIKLAQKQGKIADTYQDSIPKEKYQKIMKYALSAGFEFDEFDGQHIEGYSVVRIYKYAPVFFRLINHIDKSFEVAMRPCSIDSGHKLSNVIHLSTHNDYSAKLPAIVTKASYFMTSGKFCRVEPDSKKLIFREGHNLALGNVKNNSISFNLEFELAPEVLLHEIIHLKHPDWNEQIVHKTTTLVKRDFPGLLKKAEGLKLKLREEVTRIARDFARFDHKVGQILGIRGIAPLRPQELNNGH